MTTEHIVKNLKASKNHQSNPVLADPKAYVMQGFFLEAHHLNIKTRKGAVILNDISLAIHPGEMVILAGVEDPGVSTLIRALAGIEKTEGEVLIENLKLRENYKSFRIRIGFVAFKSEVHENLSIFEALDYASRLRLPRGTSSGERKKHIADLLDETNLGEIRSSRIRSLSKEEKKRVNIAIELITGPGIIFLDDPFLGLDTSAANRLFEVLRKLANQGLSVVLTTHTAEYLQQADKVGLLTHDKSLGWFGPPGEALDYFAPYRDESDQDHKSFGFGDVYDMLDNSQVIGQDWGSNFLASPAYKKYAGGGSKEVKQELALDDRPLAKKQAILQAGQVTPPKPASTLTQWQVLSVRNIKLLARDRLGVFVMLAVPLLLACVDFFFSSRKMYDLSLGDPRRITTSLGLLIFLAMLVGSLAWIGEFHKEALIYKRERQVGLKIFPYTMSKVWLVGFLALYQGLVWTLVHFLAASLPFGSSILVYFYVFMALVIFIGGLLGLFSSTVMSSEKKSVALLSIILIIQLVFSGAFLSLNKFNPVISSLASVIPSHFAFQGLSTADGHGKVLASDSCWQLPADQRQNLTEDQKQSLCSCMGINIFRTCNFPGVLQFYNPAVDQPAPAMPTTDQAFKFPNPPTPAPGVTLDQYAQTVKDSFATALESNLATSGIYQNQLNQYMDSLMNWDAERKSAISYAESQLQQEFDNYASDYNVNLLYPLAGLIGESIVIVILLILSVKRKDYQP